MSAVVNEMAIGRRKTGKEIEQNFLIKGATSQSDAMSALASYVSTTWSSTGGQIDGYDWSVDDSEVEEASPNLYVAKSIWKNAAPQSIGNFSLSFDISTQTTKVTQAKRTVNRYATSDHGGTSPDRDFKGAINVNEDGSIEGVDVITPVYTFKVDLVMGSNTITQSYMTTLKNLIGTYNQAEFYGNDIGEALFTSVSGSRQGGENWKVTYGFAVSRNATSLTVGEITGIHKAGWQYLWTYYTKTEDSTNHILWQRPTYVTVVDVYDPGDFTQLSIPNLWPS